ncbi:SKP1-like protein 11 [Striga hermonthica]|uniref:SKP1-like protein 11 n=1 Tax=Striga hermonthica TaxID=68872 RepID=A0A9N7NRT7_STRHE|nr:SKP1-like protein 11 [Striga hermonthica]
MVVFHGLLLELIKAANYLNIRGMLDITFQAWADMIKNMSIEEIRTDLNITHDFTKKEEDATRRANTRSSPPQELAAVGDGAFESSA